MQPVLWGRVQIQRHIRAYARNLIYTHDMIQPKPFGTKVKPIGIGIREGAIALSHGSGASPYPRLGLPLSSVLG